VWKSFWKADLDEKPMWIRNVSWGSPPAADADFRVSASFSNVSLRAVRLGDSAQKHVTRIISCLALAMAGRRQSLKMDTPGPVQMDRGVQREMSELGSS
jgi:hypothetical protein